MNKLTPLKAIRLNCFDCEGGSPKRVRMCEDQECLFFTYRFGKNPNRKGIGGRKPRISQKG
jgi:hypothetical protein